MQITYKSKKLQKICSDAKYCDRIYGKQMSSLIHTRIRQIESFDSVKEMIQFRIGRCHALVNNRKGEYAVDLVHPYRLIFVIHGKEIEIAHITEITDYH